MSGQRLVTETGGLVIEDVDARRGVATGGRDVGGYAAVADRHDVDFEILGADAIMARWPQLCLGGHEQAMYQRRSGIVDARRSNATHAALARGHGAEIREHTTVRALHPSGATSRSSPTTR